MDRKEMEEILQIIKNLMYLLMPYVNEPELWADSIGEVCAVVFATDEEY
jgi:hypothetical protein